jgi:hypothetical protein
LSDVPPKLRARHLRHLRGQKNIQPLPGGVRADDEPARGGYQMRDLMCALDFSMTSTSARS